MSAGIERRAATTRLGRWWQGWRFHLNAALLIVPLAVLPSAWNEARTVSGQLSPPHSGEAALNAGPFALRLSELAPPAQINAAFGWCFARAASSASARCGSLRQQVPRQHPETARYSLGHRPGCKPRCPGRT